MMQAKFPTLIGMGSSAMDATQLLLFRVKKQAFILAYQKTILVVVAFFSLALIPLKMLKVPRKPPVSGGPLADAH